MTRPLPASARPASRGFALTELAGPLLALLLSASLAAAGASAGLDLSLLDEGTWVEDPAGRPVIDRGPKGAWDHVAVDNPFVYAEGGTFYCFFEAENARRQEQVGLATSTDLLHWTKHEGNPVLPAGPAGSWDHQAAKIPVVAKHGETYINGKQVIEKQDPEPLPHGRAGLFTAGAAAEFDDVVLDGTATGGHK